MSADTPTAPTAPALGPAGAGARFDLTRDDRPYWRRNLFRRFAEDQKFLITTWWPAESRRFGFSFPLAVAVVAASGSADASGGGGVDLRWQRRVEAWTVGGRRDVAEGFTRLGDAESAVVLLGTTYLVSRWTDSPRMQRTASLSAEALMSTALYSGLLKRVSRRTRPASAGVGQFFVLRPEGGQQSDSFPSGHAAGAFAVAAVFAAEFSDKRWVPWVAYGSAGLIAASRVGLGRHFPSDVLAGAVLGHSVGRMVTYRGGRDRRRAPAWSRLRPLIEPDGDRIGLVYRHAW